MIRNMLSAIDPAALYPDARDAALLAATPTVMLTTFAKAHEMRSAGAYTDPAGSRKALIDLLQEAEAGTVLAESVERLTRVFALKHLDAIFEMSGRQIVVVDEALHADELRVRLARLVRRHQRMMDEKTIQLLELKLTRSNPYPVARATETRK